MAALRATFGFVVTASFLVLSSVAAAQGSARTTNSPYRDAKLPVERRVNDLLRRMTLEAPGTYHHSLMVANLAESAADAIGANPTICRVCSLYHDIGKLNKPEYYIENTHGDDNPHDDLTPSMSALVVIAHVKDGVDLALKHKLNQEIIDTYVPGKFSSLLTPIGTKELV